MRRLVTSWAACVFLGQAAFALAQEAKSVTLAVPKMYCVACELSVKKALKKVPGVESVDVDVGKKLAVVRYDPAKAQTADLIQATTKAGFPSSVSP